MFPHDHRPTHQIGGPPSAVKHTHRRRRRSRQPPHPHTHKRHQNNQMKALVAFLMSLYLAVGPISVNYNSEKNHRVLSAPLYWREFTTFQTAAARYWDSLHLPGGKRSSDLWADINCAVQFHSHESRRYCECVTQRQDTVWCRFPCHCTELPLSNCTTVPCAETICESSTCGTWVPSILLLSSVRPHRLFFSFLFLPELTKEAIGAIVVLASMVLCFGTAAVVGCWFLCKRGGLECCKRLGHMEVSEGRRRRSSRKRRSRSIMHKHSSSSSSSAYKMAPLPQDDETSVV